MDTLPELPEVGAGEIGPDGTAYVSDRRYQDREEAALQAAEALAAVKLYDEAARAEAAREAQRRNDEVRAVAATVQMTGGWPDWLLEAGWGRDLGPVIRSVIDAVDAHRAAS